MLLRDGAFITDTTSFSAYRSPHMKETLVIAVL